MTPSVRPRVLETYALLVAEELCALALPALMGAVIDGLMAGSFTRLAWLFGAMLLLIASGTGRRLWDTRVFGGWEMRAAIGLARSDKTERRIGGVRLVGDVARFFEHQMPQAISAGIGGGGALILLALYDWRAAAVAAVGVAGLVLLSRRFAMGAERLNRRLNDRIEREHDVVLWGTAQASARHFDLVRRLRVARSDLETGLFALSWLVFSAILVAALLIVVRAGHSPGAIFAQMTYLLAFADSLSALPVTLERFTQARDVLRRMTSIA